MNINKIKIGKRKARNQKKKTEKELWKNARQKAIERDRGCVICGDTKKINVHHLIPKEFKLLKFEPSNLICLCPKHHKFSLEISPHKNPFIFMHWLWENRLGQLIELSKLYNEIYIKNDKVKT